MRMSTGLRFFFGAFAVTSLTAAFIACGGSDEQDVIATDAGREGSTVFDTGAPDTNKPDTSGADTGPADTGPQYDAGQPTTLEAGAEYDGGIACVAGGQIEQEVNDDPDAANQLRLSPEAGCTGNGCSRCGVIFDSDPDAGADAADGGGAELEYVTFELQAATKSFFIQYAGDITLTVTVEGNAMQYVIKTGSSPTLPYALGKRYFIEVKSNTGQRTPWRVTLFENQ